MNNCEFFLMILILFLIILVGTFMVPYIAKNEEDGLED
jgi:hypothetical protein